VPVNHKLIREAVVASAHPKEPSVANISRTDMSPLSDQPDFVNEVITGVIDSSAALATFPTTRTTSNLAKIPVLDTKPTASFVGEDLSSDTSKKPTSEVTLTEATANIETLAVIIPIKREVALDMQENTGVDPWNLVSGQVTEAFAYAIDNAILFGTGSPASWADGLIPQAVAASNTAVDSVPLVASDISEVIGAVEADGYDVNFGITYRGMRRKLRDLIDGNNRPVYLENFRSDTNLSEVFGVPLRYTREWDDTAALALFGDSSAVRVFIREDMQVRFSEDAAFTDGGTLKSAYERNVILARFEMRLGWTAVAPRGGLPFGVLLPD
jgi:HK97 family phage major capsid protein